MTMRLRGVTAAGLLCAACVVWAQAPPAKLEFEVASIKPAQPLQAQISSGKLHVGMTIDAARVDIGSMSLAELIQTAYKVKAHQITGPDWMSSARFDVLGKMPEGGTKEQVPEMLEALLADRFKLTVHRENRDQPVYALVAGKGGPKLKDAAPEPDAPGATDDTPKGLAIGTADGSRARLTTDGKNVVVRGGQTGTTRMSPGPDGSMHLEAAKMKMPAVADMLSRFVDRPIVDMTGLTGEYQIGLDLSMADILKAARAAGVNMPGAPQGAGPAGAPADAASDPASGSVFTAVQQLGLRLEPRKSAIETIVVDHLEKTPTEN
jgi:uncharacterized protein (TIGR03435 family)